MLSDAATLLLDERRIAVREEPDLHLELNQRDVVGGTENQAECALVLRTSVGDRGVSARTMLNQSWHQPRCPLLADTDATVHDQGVIAFCVFPLSEGVREGEGDCTLPPRTPLSFPCPHQGEDNLVHKIFEVLQEESRLNITDELRRFVEVDNQEAVRPAEKELGGDHGGQAQSQQSDFPNCAHPRRSGRTDVANGRVRNTAHIHHHHCGVGRWGPSLADEDWYAVCQAICRGVD